jgi:Fe-S cluster assembly iron-binding protein IscA
MALDEPHQNDTVLEKGSYRLLVDPQTNDVVMQNGGLTIDFVDEAEQKGYTLRLNQKEGGGCGSGGGGCSSCG